MDFENLFTRINISNFLILSLSLCISYWKNEIRKYKFLSTPTTIKNNKCLKTNIFYTKIKSFFVFKKNWIVFINEKTGLWRPVVINVKRKLQVWILGEIRVWIGIEEQEFEFGSQTRSFPWIFMSSVGFLSKKKHIYT